MKTVLGIDVSKEHLDCALLEATASNNQRAANRRRSAGRRGGCACSWREANTPAGHAALVRNIQARHQAQPGSSWLVVMESTGIYSEALHRALFAAGIPAACVNPRQVRDFAASLNLRAKTDPVDARLLARYGAERQPPAQAPLSAQHQILRGLVNELDALVEDRLRLQNRRESSSTKDPVSSPEALSALHQEHLAFLDRQIATVQERINAHIAADPDLHAKSRLLCTIPGIAERTAARLLVILDERSFPSARALAAYAGSLPERQQPQTCPPVQDRQRPPAQNPLHACLRRRTLLRSAPRLGRVSAGTRQNQDDRPRRRHAQTPPHHLWRP
jgi:transposase